MIKQGLNKTQKGAALLALTTVLLFVATVGALTMAGVGQVDQRVSSNDVRTKEVYSAAVGALEYGVARLETDFLTFAWTDSDFNGASEEGDTSAPPALANITLNADVYSRNIIYTLRSDLNPADESMPRIIDITATATAVGDSHVTKTLTSTIMLASTQLFSIDSSAGLGFSGPPVLIEGCTSDITGSPDAFPLNGISIGTTMGTADDVCIDPGHLDINGGGKQALSPSQSLWDSVFGAGTTEADLLELQELMPTQVMFVDANYPYDPSQPTFGVNWTTDVGTLTAPVVLYIAAGHADSCLKINGNTVIYGLVYYADATCTSNGFGGGEINGTLAKAGDMTKLNANTILNGTDLDFGGDSGGGGTTIDIGVTVPQFTEVPGSWRDF